MFDDEQPKLATVDNYLTAYGHRQRYFILIFSLILVTENTSVLSCEY